MTRDRRDTLVLAAVLAAAVGFYAAAWGGAPATDGDSAGYLEVAADLADGQLDQLYWRPIGYPLLLLVTGSTPTPGTALVVTQLVLHALAVALFVGLLLRVRAGRAPMVAFVAVALLPPFVEHAAFVLSESMTQFFVVAGLVGFARWLLGGHWAWLVTGALALGCASLVHPADQLLWLLLPVLALLWSVLMPSGSIASGRALAGAAVVAAVAVPILGGVMAWNATRFDYAGISPMLGVTLSHKTVRVLEKLPDEYNGVREILIRHRDAALLDPVTGHLGLAYIFRALPELEAKTGLRGPALSRYLVKMNLALIRRAPMDYVDEVLRSAIWFWSPGVTDQSGFGSGALKAAFNGLRALVLVAFGSTLVLLAGPTVLLILRAKRTAGTASPPATDAWAPLLVIWLSLGAIAYSCLISITLTAAVYRLRIPVDLPILACVVLGPATWRALVAGLGIGSDAGPA